MCMPKLDFVNTSARILYSFPDCRQGNGGTTESTLLDTSYLHVPATQCLVLTCKSSIPLSHHTKKNPEKKNAAMSCSRFLSAWHIPLSMIYLETCQALLKNTTWSLGSQTTTLEYIIISTCLSESQNFQLLQNSVLFQNLRERYELVHHLPVYLLMRISYLKPLPHFPWDHSATSRRSSSLLFSSRSACEWKWKVDHDAIILPLYNSKRI